MSRSEKDKVISRVFLITCAFLASIVGISGCTENKQLLLPEEFGLPKLISLGQDVEVAEKWFGPTRNESTGCLEFSLYNSPFFARGCINCAGTTSLWGSRIESLSLEGKQDQYDTADLIARRIISLCKEQYGDVFTIRESDPYSEPGLRRPMIVWESDSCYVSFVFLPNELARKLSVSAREGRNSFIFYSALKPESSDEVPEISTVWTRETLGL